MGGAAVMAVATFLPLYEPAGLFRMVQENSLIQHGGWIIVVAAIGIASSGYRARYGKRWYVPLGIALFVAAGLALFAMDKSHRTLYPVNPLNGTIDSSGPGTVAEFGLGIYVAGLGIAMVGVGSRMLRQIPDEGLDPLEAAWAGGAGASSKKCPDCAETILADAHVCKHCGYRFPAANLEATTSAEGARVRLPADSSAEKTYRKVQCERCKTVQEVASVSTATTVTCPGCQGDLTIPPAKIKAD
jgi:phage FluMu protein Com